MKESIMLTSSQSNVLFFSFLQYFFSYYGGHVFLQGDEIYDATLNQTNVGNNNNKFYIIQVLGLSCKSLFLRMPFFSPFDIVDD
jgi:hypothetical protein